MNDTAGQNTGKKSKAVQLPDAPNVWQKYANYILIPLIIGLTVYLLVRFRMNAAAEAKSRDELELTQLRLRLHEWRVSDYAAMLPDEAYASLRDSRYAESNQLADSLLKNAKEPIIRAETTLARGDLNWFMANATVSPLAATRPALAPPKSPDQFLAAAEQDYQDVIKNFPAQTLSVATARLGLAAVFENRRQWDSAVEQYKLVADDAAIPEAYRNQAKVRINAAGVLRTPMYITRFDVAPLTTQPVDAMDPTDATDPTGVPGSTTAPATMQTMPATTAATRSAN